jgi:hypothetical protein
MPVETSSLFAQVIQDHLELKEKNSGLEGDLPIDRYKTEDPFENHPLFKTEEQARLEETMDGAEPAVAIASVWPGEETATVEDAVTAHVHSDIEDSLWGRESRDFDWGD